MMLLIALGLPGRAWPLRFRILEAQNRRVLFVFDCNPRDPGNTEPCETYEQHFTAEGDGYRGDDAVFRDLLERGRITEVIVASNGGDVGAAIPMARDLRAHGLSIRVPKGEDCISSCTIFFMGGTIRTIDPGATYQVHSASSWSEGADMKAHTVDPRIMAVAESPETELLTRAQKEQLGARKMALQLLRLFQNTLLLPTGRPPVPEDDSEIADEADRDLPPLDYRQPHSEARERDVHRIRAEGRAAVQDIMMRLEREQMASAIQWLGRRTDMGYRAAPALEMVRMMYMESIRETSTLSPSELERRGYVTPRVQ